MYRKSQDAEQTEEDEIKEKKPQSSDQRAHSTEEKTGAGDGSIPKSSVVKDSSFGVLMDSPRGVPSIALLAESPPRFVQFDDLMKVAESFTDMSLAHEITVDANFRLEKQEPPENSLEKLVRDTMVQAFWDVLRNELNCDPPIYDRALALLQEIKETLLGFLTERNVRMRQHVEEHLDLELIRQQLNHKTLDLCSYAAYVVDTMAKMCAPVRDEEVAQLRTISDPVDLLKEVFRVLDLMKMDMANFTIAQIRPFIQRNSVEYERKKFQEYLNAQKNAGLGELVMTRYWLNSACQRIQNANSASSQPGDDANISIPSISSSTSSSSLTPYNILIEACMELFDWPHTKPYPETFQLDENRLRTLCEAIHHLVMTAALVLIASNVVQTAQSQPIPHILQQLRMTLKEHIIVLMKDVLTIDFPKHADNLALQISKDTNNILERGSFKTLEEHLQMALQKQISDAVRGDNTVVQLLKNRLYSFIRQSVLSNNPLPQQRLPSGFSAVEKEMGEVCGQLFRLFSHNRSVFGPYYAEILQPLVKSNEAMSPASTPRK